MKVYVSYADADRKWLERLSKPISVLERLGQLQSWDNTRVPAGRNWREEMQRAQRATRVAVLMLSPDWLASDFITKEELPPLLAAAAAGEVDVIPVLLRPCLYQFLPGVKELKPFNQQPLAGMSTTEADEVFGRLITTVLDRVTGTVATASTTEPPVAVPSPPLAAATPAVVKNKAIILTALREEYEAVRAYLMDLKEEEHPSGTIYERGRFTGHNSTWEVGLVELGAGNAAAAFEAERAIQHFAPSVMFFVGVAGGVKDVQPGDVVVATKVYGYEAGKDTAEGFLPRPSVGETTYRLEQRARSEARKDDWLRRLPSSPGLPPKVLIGPIAAGEKVVGSAKSSVAQLIRENYSDALAVEMEGRGFLVAARGNSGVGAIVIRGISDLLDGKAAADAACSQRTAARHASAFAFEMLAKL